MERYFIPNLLAILFNSAKYGEGSSSNGGIHINPFIPIFSICVRSSNNIGISSWDNPYFCGSSPKFISIKNSLVTDDGLLIFFAIQIQILIQN